MGLLLFFFFLALGVSFLCSILEAVLLSITPSYVAALRQDGTAVGKALGRMKKDVERPLAAILTLNTFAHTVGAAGVGMQVEALYGGGWVTVASSFILTVLILYLSEIIPKTLGAVHWRRLTPAAVRLLVPMIKLLSPFVWTAQAVHRMLSDKGRGERISRAELSALTELGRQEGVFEESESRIVKNLLRFSSVTVESIMTPRTVMFAFPEDKTVGEVIREHEELPFSRIPVYSNNLDDCDGYVLRRDILYNSALDKHEVALRTFKRELPVVPESLAVQRLFERLLAEKDHVALVIDEYGGTAGLVTMEDVVETLLGLEIVDEVDTAQDMQEFARQQWKRRAQRLGIIPPSDETEASPAAQPGPLVRPDSGSTETTS